MMRYGGAGSACVQSQCVIHIDFVLFTTISCIKLSLLI